MKEIYYIANIRIPTERAHGIQIMEMCQALADGGLDVELIVPNRKNDIKDSPFAYHDIKENFKIKKLRCLDWVRYGRVGFWIESLTFALSLSWYISKKGGLFYTRDELIAFCVQILGKKVAWEAHMGHKNLFVRALIRMNVPLVVITDGLKDLYVRLGMPKDNIMVAPDAADIDRFDIEITKEEARKQLNLPQDKKIILYKGSLGKWKGVDTLADSAGVIKSFDTLFVFIGGSVEDAESFKERYSEVRNVTFLGNRPRQETPVYQKAADVLVIPNSAKEDISKLYTSPMKLFGYMAGGRPIIASDLPSIREVLNESVAYFFIADDPSSLAEAIDLVLNAYSRAEEKAQRALEKVREFSWKKRAEKILEFTK